MGMRTLGYFVFLLLVGWSSCNIIENHLPEDVANSFFTQRTGDIVIHDKTQSSNSGHVVFMNQKLSSDIKETEFADLLSHLMGLNPLNSNRSRAQFPEVDFFSKPKANLLFVLDDGEHFSSFKKDPKHEILRETYPSHKLSQLTTILSGRTPSSHGVVANQWIDRITGEKVKAQEAWNQGSLVANIQDMITLSTEGKSLVFSSAASKSFAKALSAKPWSLHTKTNNFGFYLNGQAFESVYASQPQPRILVDKEVVQTVHSASADNIVAFASGGATCKFNLKDEIDYAVLAETAFLERTLETLSSDVHFRALIRDETPDLFTFAFTSLKNVEKQYGSGSHEYKCSFNLVDKIITKAINTLNGLYDNSLLVEAVFLKSSDKVNAQVEEKVKSALPSSVVAKSTVGQFLPNIYLSDSLSAEKRNKVCAAVNEALKDSSFEALCMPEAAVNFILEENMKTLGVRASNNTISDTATFQIVLWSGVGLIVAALFAVYVMFTIDPSTDTLLYSHDINHPTAKM